ncbi:S66 family peptidase [Kitasatospora cineracea]|uniref:Muramoyltetrapeptide carboxypeptidase LdcA involved in peptidoglycan recycling n=1 Tax=Kitasatospora cineracea TaxID=88074 RepID=A0A3N4RKY7_9ACTN|nr:S66 peptidase family protein [Kitasatospora cineracea]ROR37481.1 muramoyltetrapeptide carboxypeptidase LdcA involved in peptidoglycan recycling [Kitasatospora cineracea]RPE29077.1 muramoyltetrapeptide carboxypeptidase LdcA involved in peptidoglycan recycling [Kitasatospora cineracea]
MSDQPTYPPKPRPGDRIAVVSPGFAGPGAFPLPHELGLRRLREEFGLEPVEYPATRKLGATPAERAADLHAAFADPTVTAVMATLGGDDQITVVPHLDAELIRANPKPFFGYSDNTNLLDFLHRQGIVAYHGAAVMTQLGRPHAVHPLTAASLRAALFDSGPYELTAATEASTVLGRWEDEATFAREPASEPVTGWHWHRPDRVVEGTAWGGNLEILHWMAAADRLRPAAEHAGGVLFLETSEELPSATEVFRMLRNLGERGLLRQFPALLVGRAMAWTFEHPHDTGARARYRADQRAAVLRALDAYAPDTMAVFDVDLGHTEPQLVIPYGGSVRVDGPARRITVTY